MPLSFLYKHFNFGQLYDKRHNAYDDVRFILAVAVLYVHSYGLLGKSTWLGIFTHRQVDVSIFAVYGFFVLSGFFMIQSLERNPSLISYSKHRFARILPAFWLSLGLSAFVLAPLLLENLAVFSYHPGSPLHFFIHAGSFHIWEYSWGISGMFPNNPIPEGINGSMWTLKHEVALYFALPLMLFIFGKSDRVIILITVFFTILNLYCIYSNNQLKLFNLPEYAWVISSGQYPFFVAFANYFFIGVCCYRFRHHLYFSLLYFIPLAALFIIAASKGHMKTLFILVVPYTVLFLGALLKQKWIARYGDYSYGMYIYAFPIQQLLIHLFGKDHLTPIALFIYSFLLTLILSICSWHLLEHPILKRVRKVSSR